MTWGAVIVVLILYLGLRRREPTRATQVAILCVSVVVLAYAYTGLGSLA